MFFRQPFLYLYRIHTVTFLPFRAYNTDNQLIIHSTTENIENTQMRIIQYLLSTVDGRKYLNKNSYLGDVLLMTLNDGIQYWATF